MMLGKTSHLMKNISQFGWSKWFDHPKWVSKFPQSKHSTYLPFCVGTSVFYYALTNVPY